MRLLLLSLIIFLAKQAAFTQNLRIDSLLNAISQHQISKDDAHYRYGMFASQRVYKGRKMIALEDDNIFFTALIVWTLRSVRQKLSLKNRFIVDALCADAEKNYARYQNKDGRPVYNFWQTNPSRHFPNSRYFSSRKKYIIPDDLDDTSIIYLSATFSDSLKQTVKTLISENANGQKCTIRNTYRRYKKVPAYGTWFGKNMPIDFDICVQANGLRFVLDNRLPLNRSDSATLWLVKDMIYTQRYIKRPHYVSPHYQNTAIILYHLARLVAAHPHHPLLADVASQLIADTKSQMHTSGNAMEQLLLHTSLLKLKQPLHNKISVSEKDMDDFYFFVANMTSVFPNPLKGWFSNSRKTNFFYQSKAYYLTLLLENEVYKLTTY